VRSLLLLRLGGATVRTELVRRGKVLWAGEAPFTTPEELEEAVSQLAAAEGLPARPATVRVELEPPLAQLRTLRGLPPIRTAELRSLVATQSGRYFRRNGKPLVTDACWRGREARREGTAFASAAEEPWLDAVIRGARLAGLAVEAFRPADMPEGVRLELMPPTERRRQRARALLSVRRLAVVAWLIWLVAAGAFLARLRDERAGVDREITRLEPSARALGAARRALGDAARTVATLDRATLERGRVLAHLTALAATLPDSAFITSLEVDAEGRGGMSVMARRSAEVLAAVDRSGTVLSPRLNGAVVRETIAGRDWERFAIAFGPASAR
jgi:hypothetical protein